MLPRSSKANFAVISIFIFLTNWLNELYKPIIRPSVTLLVRWPPTNDVVVWTFHEEGRNIDGIFRNSLNRSEIKLQSFTFIFFIKFKLYFKKNMWLFISNFISYWLIYFFIVICVLCTYLIKFSFIEINDFFPLNSFCYIRFVIMRIIFLCLYVNKKLVV